MKVTEKVIMMLEQAEKSQKLADLAIQSANENITLARKNLALVSFFIYFGFTLNNNY